MGTSDPEKGATLMLQKRERKMLGLAAAVGGKKRRGSERINMKEKELGFCLLSELPKRP